jgi:type I restriction enzyme S subunit
VIKQNYTTAILNRLANENTEIVWQELLPQFEQFFDTEKSIKALRQTILQLAVQGKLTKDWRKANPNTASATELLQQIKTEKKRLIAEKVIKKEKVLPKITKEEIPFELPENWVWCRLNDLVSLLGDGLHGTPKYTHNGEYYFINGNNLNDGKITIKARTKAVSKEEFLKYQKKLTDRTLFVSINGTIGNTAFYNNEKVILGKSACYFNLLKKIDKEYIRTVIKSNHFLTYTFESATGTTIKNVSLKTMRWLKIPLPPLSEQKAIVEKVASLLGYCDALEAAITERGKRVEALMEGSLRAVLAV